MPTETTPPTSVDVVIIGAGTAGLNARRAAEVAGKSALMIDPGPFGTTCARVGCMPSKLLIAAAEAAHHARHAGVFGVDAGPVGVDGVRVMARVRSERDRFAGFVIEATDEHAAGGRLLKGRARFVGPQRLQVTLNEGGVVAVDFKAAVVATGSTAWVPPPLRDLGDALVDNAGVFDWVDLPGKVLVVGAGVIGLELGQSLHRLGVETTIVGVGGGLVGLQDPVVRAAARAAFDQELDLHLDSPVTRATRHPEGGAVAHFVDRDGQARAERYDVVLCAAGRRPVLSGLDLPAAGVSLSPRGVPEDLDPSTLQLGTLPIFLAGDVNNLHPLLHEAADDGRAAGHNAAHFPTVHAQPRRTPMGVVFTDPNIGFVGLRVRDLDPRQVCMGEVSYDNQGRARVMAQNRGHLRLWAKRACGTLVAAEFAGPRMEHVAHLLAWAVQQRLSVANALAMPFYHPVVEEGLRTALRDLEKRLRFAPPAGEPCAGVTPGE